jgi:hypothetical protein
MNNVNRKQIIEAFIEMIEHLSDKNYQRRAWINGEAADFDEAVCLFFGESDPILEKYKDFGITDTQYRLLKQLRDKFRFFSDNNDFPEEFIDTPEWAKIMEMATEVLDAFNYPKKK